MKTTTCTLEFKDGVKLTARLESTSPDQKSSPTVIYPTGFDPARWPYRPRVSREATSSLLIATFQNIGEELGINVEIVEEGDYDTWAE